MNEMIGQRSLKNFFIQGDNQDGNNNNIEYSRFNYRKGSAATVNRRESEPFQPKQLRDKQIAQAQQ